MHVMHFDWMSALVFIMGTVFGSFFNVCIWRLPREESIVEPPSHCPVCRYRIQWYDNVPLLSFVMLRARCRKCRVVIPLRYPAVELITGLAYLWIWWQFGPTAQALTATFLFSVLLVASVIDFDHQIIPDETSLGGLVVGIVASAMVPALHGKSVWWEGLRESLIGMLAGGGLIYVTGVLGTLAFRKDAMGGGDVKLLAMLGAFLGWKKVLLVYLLAPIFALPLGLFLKFVKKQDVLPFGPFLAAAGWVSFVWGEQMIRWYLGGLMW